MKLQTISLDDKTIQQAQAIGIILNNAQSFADLEKINKLLGGQIKNLLDDNYFEKGTNPLYIPISKSKNSICKHLFILNLAQDTSEYEFLKKINALAEKVVDSKTTELTLCLDKLNVKNLTHNQIIEQTAFAFANASYVFDYHKSQKSEIVFEKLLFPSSQISEEAVNQMNAVISGLKLGKDLANEPSNICTPTYFSNVANDLAKNTKLQIKTLNQKQMEKLKMGSLLSVSKGSIEEPKMVFLSYFGADKKQAPIALVGKGVCFDTGGISIKPSSAMDEMKYDMCGAASVIGVMKAIESANLKVNVIGVMALVENMPSGSATKPGDIVKAYNGKTVEVLNTDAEGRLVLADALSYTIDTYKPKQIVDIATLTGLVAHFFGTVYSSVFGNNESLINQLVNAGQTSLDLTWQSPMHESYNSQLKSNFSDLPNIGNGKAGSITAAHFLEAFVGDVNWAHIDIAGVAWHSGDKKGATGRPIALLFEFLKQNQS